MAENQMQKPNNLQNHGRPKYCLTIHKAAAEEKISGEVKQRRLNNMVLRAAGKGRTRSVEALLNAGANIEANDNNCWTPLMRAAENGRIKTCLFLIGKGAVFGKDEGNFVSYANVRYISKMSGYGTTMAILDLMDSMQKEMGKEEFGAFIRNFDESFVRNFYECISGGV